MKVKTIKSLLGCLFFCALTASAQTTRSYTTNFSLIENPISESGNWVNGGAVGLDWGNVFTSSGTALGQEGDLPYADATALLQTGTWGPDQVVQATVYAQPVVISCGQEVELRLRSFIAPHRLTGYEVSYSTAFGSTIVVRWNGPIGDFTILKVINTTAHNGDVVKASMIGNLISVYKNGALLGQVTDSTYAN